MPLGRDVDEGTKVPKAVSDMERKLQEQQRVQAAQYIKDNYKIQQRALWGKTHGLVVHDLIECVDQSGDDLVITLYREQKFRDLQDGQTVLTQVLVIEQVTVRMWFVELKWKRGHLYDKADKLFIPELQAGRYDIR